MKSEIRPQPFRSRSNFFRSRIPRRTATMMRIRQVHIGLAVVAIGWIHMVGTHGRGSSSPASSSVRDRLDISGFMGVVICSQGSVVSGSECWFCPCAPDFAERSGPGFAWLRDAYGGVSKLERNHRRSGSASAAKGYWSEEM